MKREYDFRRAERGKFFRPNATLRLPIYLEKDVMSYLSQKAAKKGIPVNDMVNELLKREIAVIEMIETA